uniref:Uncharacterized protein n=1 Tax=Arundo donax TaxID=35708 RepID=A0A0A9H318_ARUDO
MCPCTSARATRRRDGSRRR